MLQIRNIGAAYGKAKVLHDISLGVGAGQIVALLGSNGAGKTTILKTISGIVQALSGEIRFCGNPITSYDSSKVAQLGIAHCPEGRRLFGGMTVEDNLILGAVTPEARDKEKENLEWVFELFPILKERRKQHAGLLSGGQQQMVAIGRALMAAPRLLMMDEPSLGLAPKVASDVFDVIAEVKDSGVTVLLVEQNVAQALHIADKAYVVEQGEITIEGTSEELLADETLQKAYMGV